MQPPGLHCSIARMPRRATLLSWTPIAATDSYWLAGAGPAVCLSSMGANESLQDLEPLQQLAGPSPISADDAALWDQIFALHLPLSSEEEMAEAAHAFCAEMSRNNPRSGNLPTLVRKLTELLFLACRPKARDAHVQQSASCVYLLRLCIKHMAETLRPDELEAQLCAPAGAAGAAQGVVGPLVEALLTVLVSCEVSDTTYWLHMECLAALMVCMSTQLYLELAEQAPQPLLVAVLTSGGPGAELLVARLLSHVIAQPAPPPESKGVLRSLGSAASFVLLLPYVAICRACIPNCHV